MNYIGTRKRQHGRKPGEQYPIIESCSKAQRLELFARGARAGWTAWGNQSEDYEPGWATYAHISAAERRQAALEFGGKAGTGDLARVAFRDVRFATSQGVPESLHVSRRGHPAAGFSYGGLRT